MCHAKALKKQKTKNRKTETQTKVRRATRFSVSIDNVQADTRWDGQTCLAKPNSQARTETGKFFPVQLADHEQDWQLSWLICTAVLCHM